MNARVTVRNIYYDKDGDFKPGELEEVIGKLEPFCCDDLEEAYEGRFVDFGEYDSLLNHDDRLNIYKCAPYPEGAVWDEMAIRYCPFCGRLIERHIES